MSRGKHRKQKGLARTPKAQSGTPRQQGKARVSDIITANATQPFVDKFQIRGNWTIPRAEANASFDYETEVHNRLNTLDPEQRKRVEADDIFASAKIEGVWETAWRRLDVILCGTPKIMKEVRDHLKFRIREVYHPLPPKKVPLDAWLLERVDEATAQNIYDELLAKRRGSSLKAGT